MHNDIETILFTNDDIARAVARLGRQLSQEYADKKPAGGGYFARGGTLYDRPGAGDGLHAGNRLYGCLELWR